MADFMKNRTELIVHEEYTGCGYIVELNVYEREELLGGLLNEDGSIPPNRSFINELRYKVFRYYDNNKVITKEEKCYTDHKYSNKKFYKVSLFTNGVLNDRDGEPAVTKYLRNGKVQLKRWYTNGQIRKVDI